MSRFSPKELAAILGLLALAFTAGGWSWQQYGRAEKAEKTWRLRQNEWAGMQSANPVPIVSVATELEQQVAAVERDLGKLRSLLGGADEDPIWGETPPAQRADAFFGLAQFVEAQRGRARQAGVQIPDGTQFGFSDYANSGPATEMIGEVFRQQLVMDRLLSALWRAHPLQLVRTQRDLPRSIVTVGGPERRRGGARDDFLDWPESRRLARAGVVDTEAFCLGFVGQTSTLRRFLRELQQMDIPVAVRQIEVEPAGSDGRTLGGARSLADLFRDEDAGLIAIEDSEIVVPVIAANDSTFSVTIEYLDFVGPTQKSADSEGEKVR